MLDRLHLDPIVGLILPGAGDALTGAAGIYLVIVGVRLGMPPVVIARMMLNLAIDLVVGAIPLVGDLFDFGFRANKRNLALIEARVAGGKAPAPGDWLVVAGAALLLLAALALPVVLLVLTLRAIF